MNSQVQFGDKWVQVKGSIFYLTPPALEILRMWYSWSLRFDADMPEESRLEELEYFAKAFELLKPQDNNEASHYLTLLANMFVQTDHEIKEIIDRIHASKSGNVMVREL